MTKSKAKLGAGNVPIVLDGEEVILRPTLKACQEISRMNNGIMGALEQLQRYDLNTYVQIISVGLGLTGRDVRALPEKVWRTGMVELIGPVTRYLTIIASGGRLPSDAILDETEDEDESENPPMKSL